MTTELSTKPNLVVYPGTFDPITFGHIDIIKRALMLFDKIIVAIALNPSKTPLFTLEERMEMIRQSFPEEAGRIIVDSTSGLIAEYAARKNARAIIRGLRAVSDFDYEFQLAGMNRHLMPEVETVFLTPSDKYQFISSTFVREIASLGGEVDKFVSQHVQSRLSAKVAGLKAV